MEARNRVEIITVNFNAKRELSSHQIFVSKSGKTVGEAIEPLCQSKGLSLDSVRVLLGSDKSNTLPLTYDLYSLAGCSISITDQSIDEPDLWYNKFRAAKSRHHTEEIKRKRESPLSPPLSSQSAVNQAAQSSTVSPFIVRKMYNTKPNQLPPAAGGVTRSTSGAAMMSARRPRSNDPTAGSMGINKLLHLSEEYKNNHQSDEDTDHSHKHKKVSSSASLSLDEQNNGGDTSPSGTLGKNQRQSTSKLGFNNNKAPLNKSYHHMSAQELLVSFVHAPDVTMAKRSASDHRHHYQFKEREKLDILTDLLDQWSVKGLPKMPPLLNIGLPKFDQSKFEIEEHWTTFIDKTGLTQRQKDQQEALWELLYTEVEYIRALYVIHDLFMCCLLNIQSEQALNEMEVDKMFANITELATVNSDFWINDLIHVLEHSRANRCLFNPSLLKPAFMSFEEKFKPYTEYCVSQGKCSEYVKKRYRENTAFRNFVIWAEAQKQCNRLKLHDLLVKPMQRITRYSLLLRAIAKKTDEPDVKQDLQEMIERVDKFVTEVDQTLRLKFEKEKLQAMASRIESYDAVEAPLVDSECSKILTQTYMSLDLMSPMPGCGRTLRCLLMDGPLRLRDTNTKTDVHCILFTDMLVFTKPSKRDKLKIIKPPIKMDSIAIHEIKENPFLLLVHLTDFGVAQAAYTLHGESETIGKWAKQFKKAQHQYMKAKEAARKEPAIYSDYESDDIGFAGPLSREASNTSDRGGIISMESDGEQPTTLPERTSSYNSLTNGSSSAETVSNMIRSETSPDIGRKHHTLPPNYKHHKDGLPPVVRVTSNTSSEGSRYSSEIENSDLPNTKRKIASSRRRDANRYRTADSIHAMKQSDSLNTDMYKRFSWAEDDQGTDIDGVEHAVFSLREDDSQSSSTSSLVEVNNRIVRSHSREITPPDAISKVTAALKGAAVTDLRETNDGGIRPAANSGRPPRKLSHLELVRMKKLLLTQGTPGEGVEI